MIVDTSALLAFFDRDEPDHDAVSAVISGTREPLVVSPFVVAELDYLVRTRLGVDAEVMLLGEVAGGAWELATIDVDDLSTMLTVIKRYRDSDIGVADASNVVLAERHRTTTIATLDRQHFRMMRPWNGGHFEIVP